MLLCYVLSTIAHNLTSVLEILQSPRQECTLPCADEALDMTQVDLAALPSGVLLLAYNDQAVDRSCLALATSIDGGASWRRIAVLEQDARGSFHYPTIQHLPAQVSGLGLLCRFGRPAAWPWVDFSCYLELHVYMRERPARLLRSPLHPIMKTSMHVGWVRRTGSLSSIPWTSCRTARSPSSLPIAALQGRQIWNEGVCGSGNAGRLGRCAWWMSRQE